MSQGRNRNHPAPDSRSRSRSRSKSRSRSRSRSSSLVSTASGRAARSRKWDGESGYRVHISPLNPRTSRHDIEKIFSKFGLINEVWMATNPPCFAFVNFRRRSDADDAIQEYDGKTIDGSRVGLSFARKRTIGGRRGGGGGGHHSNGGDRNRGDYDSSRSRGRYSPRRGDDRYSDRRYRHGRSRSPVQRNRRDDSSRSRSRSPKRRNRASPRDRSPQQPVTVVRRFDDNED